MSLYLAIDTATDRASLAVGSPDQPEAILETVVAGRRDLSREIERVAADLIGRAGASPKHLRGVIVADGPGTFTGLRIGIAFAQGFARAAGVPLFTAPSLLAAAFTRARLPSLPTARPPDRLSVTAQYDALRGEVYRMVCAFDHGDVAAYSEAVLAPAGMPDGVVATEADASAAALVRLAGVGAVEPIEAAGWEPNYGRLAEAEARRIRAEKPA